MLHRGNEEMKESFDKALSFVLSWEGGYSNDPNDAGGETNFGISKRAYPNEDIKNMTMDRAMEIYRNDYWNACNCDDLPYPLDMVIFDTAVNMGVGRAKSFKETDWKDYLMQKISFYADISKKGNNIKFLRGWINRSIALWKTLKKEVT
jgi:hypothetical protein